MSDLTDHDLVASYLLHVDGAAVPVTNLYGEFGEVVHDWKDAHRFVAGPLPNGDWIADFTADYDVHTRQ